MALISHFDIELYQMDVKIIFFNGDMEEEVYIKQPEDFILKGNDHLVSRFKKSINWLKQASRQWYLKFHHVISSFDLIENIMDECIYYKVNGNKIIFLVLYVHNILLPSSNLSLFHEVKRFLSM